MDDTKKHQEDITKPWPEELVVSHYREIKPVPWGQLVMGRYQKMPIQWPENFHGVYPPIEDDKVAMAGEQVGKDWPKDPQHDAAREIVMGGGKKLVPAARKAIKETIEKADAGPTGREKSDHFLGRAIRFS